MTKSVNDLVIDGALDVIATATRIDVCSSAPTTLAEATTTYTLANDTLSSGDYTKANGDTSGRKVTCGGTTGTSITSSGTATHVALTDGTNLLLVTSCTSQALTSGGTVDIGSFKDEIADPT